MNDRKRIVGKKGTTHWHNGRRTNSLSNINLCGISSLLSEYTMSSYNTMSRSITRGPLSMSLTLPISFSIDWRASRSSIGDNVVSTCDIFVRYGHRIWERYTQYDINVPHIYHSETRPDP